jgi:tetratricopeptide (TPR) repeat protein
MKNPRIGKWLRVAVLVGLTGCSRDAIEAVNLANEADELKKTNIDGAIDKYEAASEKDPSNHRILWKLALAYQKKDDWAKVGSTCAKAEAADEKSNKRKTFASYHFLHGHALLALAGKGNGGWADAKGPLTTAVQIDPNYAEAYRDLGDVLLHLDDEQGALEHYTKAAMTRPDHLEYYVPLADLYRRLGLLDLSAQVLKEALGFAKAGDEQLFSIHALQGFLLELKGDLPGSLAAYELAKKACGDCDKHREAYFYLGSAYFQAGASRKTEALQQLRAFWKTACVGGLAARYGDQCAQAREIGQKLGESFK